jgi:hypothetical protein
MKTRTKLLVKGATVAAGIVAKRASAKPAIEIDMGDMMGRVQEMHAAHTELRAAHAAWLERRTAGEDARHAGDEMLHAAIERVLKTAP